MGPEVNIYTLKDLKSLLPEDLKKMLNKRDGAFQFRQELPKLFESHKVSHEEGQPKTLEQRIWELVGLHYLYKQPNPQPHDAALIFSKLYDHQLKSQKEFNHRVHKGVPLLWMYECFRMMGYPNHALRYLMLCLCENAIRTQGKVNPEESAVYFRAVWRHGLSDFDLKRYYSRIYNMWNKHPNEGLFPEWLLQEINQDWMVEFPSIDESTYYFINQQYVDYLMSFLGDKSGQILERLAKYLLSCIPGCRTNIRQRSYSTEYDLICSLDGIRVDFRAELGRYFVCECKDYKEDPVDYSTVAKFCRVLDSTKCHFGILFSTHGISGEGKALYGEREQLKVYQDRGMVIVVINKKDLEEIAKGANFINILRSKYEKVRLDLIN
jgi:hypothetical protein